MKLFGYTLSLGIFKRKYHCTYIIRKGINLYYQDYIMTVTGLFPLPTISEGIKDVKENSGADSVQLICIHRTH
jgi:hypothetical protein